MALKDRQAAFVREYVRCGNAAEAYRRAGYSCKNAHYAANAAARLMVNDGIRQAIDEARAQLQKEEVVTTREVFAGLKREARGRRLSKAADRINAWKAIADLLAIQKRAELLAEAEAWEEDERRTKEEEVARKAKCSQGRRSP